MTELQPDTMNLQTLKFGMTVEVITPTVDIAHTIHYATGYLFKQVEPRLAMATHLSYDEEMVPEIVSGIHTHDHGLSQSAAADGVIVNVTKKAIWTRKTALPESTNFARPSAKDAKEIFDIRLTKTTVDFPDPRHRLADIEDPASRNVAYDAKLYYLSQAQSGLSQGLQNRYQENDQRQDRAENQIRIRG